MSDDARSIQIEEDLTFQSHQMRFERIGWAVLALLLVAALLGLLGRGPLSAATAGDAGEPIRVEYERIERKLSPTTITVVLTPEAASNGMVRVWIDRDWLDEVTFETISPEPESVEIDPQRLIYVFAVNAGQGQVEVVFHLEHGGWGWRTGEIGLDGGPSHEFAQFVFP